MRRFDTETWESVSTALGRVQGGRWGVESLSQRGRQSRNPQRLRDACNMQLSVGLN